MANTVYGVWILDHIHESVSVLLLAICNLFQFDRFLLS